MQQRQRWLCDETTLHVLLLGYNRKPRTVSVTMAGRGGRRGGGRGRGSGLSFNVEQLGLTRQEAAVTLSLQPPPTFPPLDFSPAPLVNSEENTYLAVLLREQRRNLRESGFNVQPCTPPQIVERYSDRYQAPKAPEVAYDLSYFPSELKISKKKKKARKSLQKSSKGCDAIATGIDIQKKLQALEETEGKGDSGEEEEEVSEKKPKDADDEDEEEGVEDIDEEELEEETDYVAGYFDNGEGYLEEEDDNLDDGAVY